MPNELEKLQKENNSLKKEIEGTQKVNAKIEKENDSLTEAQQELKAKIKELTTNKPKITSGHTPGSIKYVRQERVKKK